MDAYLAGILGIRENIGDNSISQVFATTTSVHTRREVVPMG
jgi:hypothetical protein